MASFPLLERFPALAGLEPVSLCETPTPVEPLAALGAHAFVKRDDRTRTDQGGNKPRKLEFVLPEVRRKGARHVVTMGASGTNAGLATARLCAREGLGCEVLTFPQPETDTVRRNAAALRATGARVRPFGSVAAMGLAWTLHPRRLDPRTYFLNAGCSNPVATFGYVNAALELAAQVDAGLLAAPRHIVVAAGTGTTFSGLAVGSAIALPGCTVHGVQVTDPNVGPIQVFNERVVRQQIATAWKDLRRADPKLPASPADNVRWHVDQLGPGYGAETPASAAAVRRAADLGIELEPTYTGKSFATFLEVIEGSSGPAVFWLTYSRIREL